MPRADAERRAVELAEDIAFNEAARCADYPPSADRALWCAVLYQAIEDAHGEATDRESLFERPRSKAWLADDGGEFRLVCELADLDPSYIRAIPRRAA